MPVVSSSAVQASVYMDALLGAWLGLWTSACRICAKRQYKFLQPVLSSMCCVPHSCCNCSSVEVIKAIVCDIQPGGLHVRLLVFKWLCRFGVWLDFYQPACFWSVCVAACPSISPPSLLAACLSRCLPLRLPACMPGLSCDCPCVSLVKQLVGGDILGR